MPETRLGDIIDDHCTRCRRVTDHSVVALVGHDVRKVRCRTCHFEHNYRQAKAGSKKPKLSPYEQILASMNRPMQSLAEAQAKTRRARKSPS